MKKIAIVLMCMFCFVQVMNGQIKKMNEVNLDDLITETQFTNDNTEDLEMIWWMPAEYWEAVFSREEFMSDAEVTSIVNTLKKYVLVIVIKGKFGMFGGITYDTRESILNSLNVYYNGSALKYLEEDKLDPDLKNFITMIGPLMKNMIGQMGENMQIFTYENDKKNPVDALGKGNLTFDIGSYEAKAELPLGSFLIEKKCPEDQKLFSGKWSYCPFHGTKLVPKDN